MQAEESDVLEAEWPSMEHRFEQRTAIIWAREVKIGPVRVPHEGSLIVAIYVDDFLIFWRNKEVLNSLEET